jgi:hypothetical protein
MQYSVLPRHILKGCFHSIVPGVYSARFIVFSKCYHVLRVNMNPVLHMAHAALKMQLVVGRVHARREKLPLASLCLSFRLYVCVSTAHAGWMLVHFCIGDLCLEIFGKNVHICIKSDTNIGHLTWRSIYFAMWNILQCESRADVTHCRISIETLKPFTSFFQLGPCIFKFWWRKNQRNAFSK